MSARVWAWSFTQHMPCTERVGAQRTVLKARGSVQGAPDEVGEWAGGHCAAAGWPWALEFAVRGASGDVQRWRFGKGWLEHG